MSVVCNTTVLSNFAAIDQIDVLRQLFKSLYIPAAVYDEISRGLDEGYTFYRALEALIYPFHDNGWIRLTNVAGETELHALGTLPRKIHRGEAECLVIAQQRAWLFLSDDRAARKIAVNWGITLSGTLGCLVLAIEQQYYPLAQANHYLVQMIDQGYRSPIADLSVLL